MKESKNNDVVDTQSEEGSLVVPEDAQVFLNPSFEGTVQEAIRAFYSSAVDISQINITSFDEDGEEFYIDGFGSGGFDFLIISYRVYLCD